MSPDVALDVLVDLERECPLRREALALANGHQSRDDGGVRFLEPLIQRLLGAHTGLSATRTHECQRAERGK